MTATRSRRTFRIQFGPVGVDALLRYREGATEDIVEYVLDEYVLD